MYIGNNFMVTYKMVDSSIWHDDYFITENAAKECANNAYASGAVFVALYRRGRVGYHEIKRVKQDTQVARIKRVMMVEKHVSECEDCIITYNDPEYQSIRDMLHSCAR